MASATIPHPPSPEMVYRTYIHEVKSSGTWGAYARTASHYHKPSGEPYSDEWARRRVKQHEATHTPAERLSDDALTYTPPPGGYPEPAPIANTDPPTATEMPTEMPTPELVDYVDDGESERENKELAIDATANSQRPRFSQLPKTPTANRQPSPMVAAYLPTRVVASARAPRPGLVPLFYQTDRFGIWLGFLIAALLIWLCQR
jgi:hypothetical protein